MRTGSFGGTSWPSPQQAAKTDRREQWGLGLRAAGLPVPIPQASKQASKQERERERESASESERESEREKHLCVTTYLYIHLQEHRGDPEGSASPGQARQEEGRSAGLGFVQNFECDVLQEFWPSEH